MGSRGKALGLLWFHSDCIVLGFLSTLLAQSGGGSGSASAALAGEARFAL